MSKTRDPALVSDELVVSLQRLNDANVLLAQINRLVFEVNDSAVLLRQLCQLTVECFHARLTFVTRPDEQGRFGFFAAAGESEYLNDVFMSTDTEIGAGQGGVGQAWREARAYFINDFSTTSFVADWRARALDFGLHSAAVLPIFRQGKLWALCVILMAERYVFDDALQSLLEVLAKDVSLCLECVMAQRLQHALLDNTVVGIALTAERSILFYNQKFSVMFGYTADELKGLSTRQIYADDDEYRRVGTGYANLRGSGTAELQAVRFARKDGSLLLCDISGVAFGDENDDDRVVWTLVDVGVREQQTQYLLAMQQAEAWQARHDSLTELPNRFALEQYLPQAIARARRTGTVLAIGFLDLDDFKSVNDTLGHGAGDDLLRQLAVRLRERLRVSDFLARLGGDEFVVVIEDFDALQFADQLSAALERLHQAVESPFSLLSPADAVVGMSMGVVLFPRDSENPDELLRLADVSMYQIKKNKVSRQGWWQQIDSIQMTSINVQEDNFLPAVDPYGEEAKTLLADSCALLDEITVRFLQVFDVELMSSPQWQAVFSWLKPPERVALKARQMAHLQFVMHSATRRQDISNGVNRVGTMHVLMGIDALNLIQASVIWRRVMTDKLSQINMIARTRYVLMSVVEARLHDDIQAQVAIGKKVVKNWFEVLDAVVPDAALPWVEVQQAELNAIGQLPGIQVCVVLRPNSEGVFKVEASAGKHAEVFHEIFCQAGKQIRLDIREPGGQGLVPLAFRDGVVHTTVVHGDDEHVRVWHEDARRFGVFSMAAIPLPLMPAQPRMVLALYGAYPNQFNTDWVAQFCRGLQQRWSGLLLQRDFPLHEAISQGRAVAYRERLFAGGLRMLVQPVVDLSTGTLVKAEVLARLMLEDGSMVMPNIFLPLLGIEEMDHLFRLGLDVALTCLKQWEAQGLVIEVSINLSPTTLLNAECPSWVEAALRQHGVAPQRLVLELLETHEMNGQVQQDVVEQLHRLGVKLAMDDLGSGYSSLLRMADMPFDIIKADQGLLRHLRKNPVQTLALIMSILQMGRDFEREVVIEGLEDVDMIEAVTLLGARCGQGYALARPMPVESLAQWSVPAFGRTERHLVINSYLAALAWHWTASHGMVRQGSCSEGDCPFYAFLRAQQPPDEDALRWHALFQQNDSQSEEAGRYLMNWLVKKVQEGT